MKIFQKGFNYSQDGPGNRLVFHMQGCNFRCPWCANPESISAHGKTSVDYTEEELLRLIEDSRLLFYDNGGVTFTGGEPTLQFDALKSILKKLDGMQIHTAIETNGSCQQLPQLFDTLKLLIIDLKSCNDEKHRSVVAHGNEVTKSNILTAASQNVDLLIRIPLIHGFNTDRSDASAFAEFLKPLHQRVELLKYHEYGRKKWESLGLTYTIQDGFVKPEEYEFFVRTFRENNIQLVET